MAFLRCDDGLWLLGAVAMAFLRLAGDPNSVGAGFLWHFCANEMTPCDWLGEALLFRHCCVCALTSPVERSDFGISAWS